MSSNASSLNVQGFGLSENNRHFSIHDRTHSKDPAMSNNEFTGWRTSSYSGEGNSCVEVASVRDDANPQVGVRDTKRNGRGPVLRFTPSAWQEFLSRVR